MACPHVKRRGGVTMTVLTLLAGSVVASPAHGSIRSQQIGWQLTRLPPATGAHPASFGEPGLATGPHGLLVASAAEANVGFPTWWVSHNDGRSWGAGQDYDSSGS